MTTATMMGITETMTTQRNIRGTIMNAWLMPTEDEKGS